jgi:flagellar protein FlaG
MDGLANVSNTQQQTQTNSVNTHEKVQETQEIHKDLIKEAQDELKDVKLDSKEEVESLVEKLNDAISPMDTSLKFGVDKDDIYYVSVIDKKTNHMIRRFPAEKAQDFLPKMQEVSGILFDQKG